MSAASPSPYGVTVAFLAISTVISLISEKFLGRLSVWSEYFLYNFYGRLVSSDPEISKLFQDLWSQSGLIVSKPTFDKAMWVPIILVIALALLSGCIRVGYESYALKVSRGEKTGFRELTTGFGFVTKTVVIIIVRAIVIAVLTCLLIVPGVIAAYSYRMTYYVMLDNPDWGPLRCMRESRRLMRGKKGALFLLDLSFLPWYLLCWVTMGVMYIWKQPVFSVTYSLFYGEICGRSSWDFTDGPEEAV